MIHRVCSLIDLILPPTDQGRILRHWDQLSFDKLYRPHHTGSIQVLTDYHIPAVQAAVAACKFERNQHAARRLGGLLSQYLQEQTPVTTVLIPIPLSAARQKKRGYNQIMRVLHTIGSLPYPTINANDILLRPVDTLPQTSLSRCDRLKNMHGVFTVNLSTLKRYIAYKRIIICDDVTTTSATLAAARTALAPHLPSTTELICLAWTH